MSKRSLYRTILVCLLCAATITVQAGQLTRYPYVQNVTGDSVVIAWRTDVVEDSIVEYGTTPDMGSSVLGNPSSRNHRENENLYSPSLPLSLSLILRASVSPW